MLGWNDPENDAPDVDRRVNEMYAAERAIQDAAKRAVDKTLGDIGVEFDFSMVRATRAERVAFGSASRLYWDSDRRVARFWNWLMNTEYIR